MKTYYQNGTMSEVEYIFNDTDTFAIQYEVVKDRTVIFYPGDSLIYEINSELAELSNKFANLYFHDLDLYYSESSILPVGLHLGGQSSEVMMDKLSFLKCVEQCIPYFDNIYRHLYVNDCQYLIATVQNLLSSVEHCFVQYYTQIVQIKPLNFSLGNSLMITSSKTMELTFFLETFFTKLYSILDLMVKIAYEFEHPIDDFMTVTKLGSSEKIWGNRKQLMMNNLIGTVFEDCEVIRKVESLRNEAVHNGTWEFSPKVYVEVENQKIIERYMIFPDFEEGRLCTVKNRRHFFSARTKVNEVLVLIHDEFCRRLLTTLRCLNTMEVR